MEKRTSKPITLEEFLDLTRCIRMLYDLQPAQTFFEKNLEEFTGYTLQDFMENVVKKDKDVAISSL